MSSETMQVNIYHIDKTLFENKSNDLIVKEIINEFNEKLSSKGRDQIELFDELELREDLEAGSFNVRLFFSQKSREPKWKNFIKPLIEEDSPLLSYCNHDVSFVCFIYDKNYIFAISGGQGNFLVQDYINPRFGIEILSKLISKNSPVIKSLNDRGLTGIVLASTRFFRYDQQLAYEDNFGKLYKEIKAELNIGILSDRLGFSREDIRRNAGCIAKSNFLINKSIDFNFLLTLLQNLEKILQQENTLELNKVILLSKRVKKNRIIIEELEKMLLKFIYDFVKSQGETLDFDFCHEDYEKFFFAKEYKIFKGYSKNEILQGEVDSLSKFDFLRSIVERIDKEIADDKNKFKNFFKELRMQTFDDDGNLLTAGRVLNHFHGEIRKDHKPFFLIDKEWYEIEDTFISDLNSETSALVKEKINEKILNLPWEENYDENEYNQQYLGKDDFIVLDKILSDKIEICDILFHDDKYVYLIHVKNGFDNSIRDLTAQIYISARRVTEGLKAGNFDFLERLYKDLYNKKNSRNEYFIKVYIAKWNI